MLIGRETKPIAIAGVTFLSRLEWGRHQLGLSREVCQEEIREESGQEIQWQNG